MLTTQVISQEVSRCYDDVNICLWTDGSQLNQSAAQTACRQRNNSFLPRVTNSNIQAKLAEFRRAAWNLFSTSGFLIDVRATYVLSNFHWIDNSSLAGQFVSISHRRIARPYLYYLVLHWWCTVTNCNKLMMSAQSSSVIRAEVVQCFTNLGFLEHNDSQCKV